MAKLSSTHIYGDLYVDGLIDGKVSKDSAGQQINTTYIKGLSVSGKTITYTKGDGTTGTITTQDTNTTYSAATQSAAGLMSAADKTKLDGIATGANKYTHPSYTAKSSGFYKVTVDASGHVSATTAVAKADITGLGIPAQDTTYSAATTSAAGLMSAADKTKLDGIATSANNYSHPNSGATAGSYGPSANASPAHSGTFSVPYITINAAGHITSASTKTITLPADNNTDTKVTYTLGTTTKYYMGGPTATATGTGGITFDTGIYATTTAGQLQVTGGLITGSTIKSDAAVTDDLGTGALPWKATYSKQFTVAGEASKTYGYLTTQTVGTTDTVGVCRLSLGNSTASGTASNAKGHIHLYGSSSGYTNLTPGNNGTSNITVTLPSATGSLPIMSKGDTSYWGLCPPDGGTGWIRTTSSGLIPSANGSGALGTSSWQFSSIYGQTIYENGTALSSKYAAASHGTHLTIGTGASNAAAGNHTHNYAGSSSAGGAATSAAKLSSARSIGLGGVLSGSANFDGSAGITISASIAKPSKSGDWWSGGLVTINTDGVMEVGKYIDLHHTDTTTKDFSTRIQTGGDNGNTITLPTSDGTLALTSHTHSYAASSHTHSYLALSGGTLTGPVTVSGESKFHNGTYSDPWSGTGCCIKGTGNIGITGAIRANSGVATLTATNGVATSDGATYVANLRYANSRGYCDLGSNTVPGRLYIRSGQGTAGSGVCVENKVTNGYAYVQYLSPEGGTIALTSHLSDRTKKENIVYVGSKDSEFTNKDFYDFIRDDLGLATYNYNEEYTTTDTHTKLNFIAQDILYDYDNDCDNKVGNLIVQTENAMETQGNLRYDPEIYTSVIAGALKESINKIEELESDKARMQAEIDELKADLTELKAIVKGLL